MTPTNFENLNQPSNFIQATEVCNNLNMSQNNFKFYHLSQNEYLCPLKYYDIDINDFSDCYHENANQITKKI